MSTVAAARPRKVVVLSTHLDDAVLCLGAWIHRLTRTGTEVEIVTVLGDDPGSQTPAGWWDQGAGFATEGEAAQARRREDERACAIVGAARTVLPYGDMTYGRGAADDTIWNEVAPRLRGADVVMVPGSPLLHEDHQWLAHLALSRDIPARVGLYVEQPYSVLAKVKWWRWRWRPVLGQSLRGVVPDPSWRTVRAALTDRMAKWRACRAYRSQLRLLGRKPPVLWRMMFYETVRRGEGVAWPDR